MENLHCLQGIAVSERNDHCMTGALVEFTVHGKMTGCAVQDPQGAAAPVKKKLNLESFTS